MTDFGSNGEVLSKAPAYTAPGYAVEGQYRKIRRIKLGLFLSSLTACLSVTLLGALGSAILFTVMNAFGVNHFYDMTGSGFPMGLMLGVQMATYNFILFFITVPVAWAAMGFSIGRFPHRGIANRMPYIRWAAIWGMILVGGTTLIFGGLIGGLLAAFGALLVGLVIGLTAGICCGLLFYAIVKPAEQLHDTDISVF